MIAGDNEFDLLWNVLKEKHNIKCNPTAADKHVAEVECMVQVTNERMATIHLTPIRNKKMMIFHTTCAMTTITMMTMIAFLR